MKSTVLGAFAFLATVGLISGCGVANKLGGDGGQNSQEVGQVSGAMAEDLALVEDGLFEDEGVTAAAVSRGGVASEATVRPFRFWRHITRADRHFEFAFSDTDSTGRPSIAVVTVQKDLLGTFNLVAGDSGAGGEGDSSGMRLIRKPLADRWVRRVLLHREARADSEASHGDRWKWRVVASSAVKVSSIIPNAPETHIVSVRIQCGDRDTILTDPLGMLWRQRLPSFPVGSQVTITVATERSDDVVLLLHHDRRFRLEPLGENLYRGVWTVPAHEGIQHVGINAFARGTLFDDAAPYSSQAWLWAYGIREGVVAQN